MTDASMGLCASAEESSVELSGSESRPGDTGSVGSGSTSGGSNDGSTGESAGDSNAGGGSTSGSSTSTGSAPAPAPPAALIPPPVGDNGFGDGDVTCRYNSGGFCIGDYIPDLPPSDDADADSDDATDASPTVTIADIASFSPQAAVQFMQPDGWMVVGLPANFYARIDAHVVSGTLLGAPADVRFTPRAYRWDYGDGSAAVHGTPGDTWEALGLAEFDATTTSHVYTAEGEYTIALTVVYTAEYRWAGGPWTGIAGAVELPANPLQAVAASDAVTVLVDRDCTSAPAGPGC